jgi:adenosylmethionine-8-amino-7-oxononanoate aminotransferase
MDKVVVIAEKMAEFVEELSENKNVRAVRSFGAIMAIEIETSGESSYFNDAGRGAYKWFLDKGIILRPLGNVIVIIPPYCIKEEELRYIFNTIKDYLKELNLFL